jgi:hypothetical protein
LAVRLMEDIEPALYVARATEWREPQGCINFNAGGGNAGPYYEMSFARKHAGSLERFTFKKYIASL